MAEGVCGVQFTVGAGQNWRPLEPPSVGSERDERVPLKNPEYNKVLHSRPCCRQFEKLTCDVLVFALEICDFSTIGIVS